MDDISFILALTMHLVPIPAGHWWAVLGAMGLVAISAFALVMLLLVIKYLKRDKEAVS